MSRPQVHGVQFLFFDHISMATITREIFKKKKFQTLPPPPQKNIRIILLYFLKSINSRTIRKCSEIKERVGTIGP